ncbi:inositol phosphophingolipids phospholipase C [Cylindrobasidium torrendii FP15055 ss-10]|uniref:Inositol phosphophingolipids phospholipase C n=1 Tax=Cylindrobasidium torrendii FP15055 ss-10 TaxID=1314674 RepID=A0A0D7BSN1_9AGAR|nr:inositol phosphophingolipids phospholipase C [Cylindrobasidium torrendii FP15055 ss-10]
MADHRIRLLTLNCWGLKFVAKNRTQRVQAIATELAASTHDIVTLQELWVLKDYEYIRTAVIRNLPYSKFFYSGALGAGLCIFSRFPIISTAVHPYSLNGEPLDVAAGDWFVGKAAASVVLLHPILGELQVFNTHLFAKGGEEGPEYRRAHRLVNAWEFAKLVRQAAELGRYVIAAGDFNSVPSTLPMTIIRDHASLYDSWVETHGEEDPLQTSIPPPPEAIKRFGVTADSPLNSYSAGKPLDAFAKKHWGKRLDYIFYRQPTQVKTNPAPRLQAIGCKVVMTENVPGQNFSFSDHFGLEAVFDVQQVEQPRMELASELSDVSISTVVSALSECYRFSRARAKKELTIFVLCLGLLIALIIGSSWLPHSWINPIFLVFTVFIAWLATTMLYSGFLYGQWECNALTNVVEELEIFKKGADFRHGRAMSP